MIRAGFVVLAGALLAVGAAAQVETNPQAPATPSITAQSQNGMAGVPSGTAINAQLNSSVDSKKAKVGDKVEAHTTEEIKYAGKAIVPRGTKLEGHVTEATARSKGDSGSTLAIQFDKAIPKKGEEISLNVTIMAVAAPQNDNANGSAGNDPMSATSSPANPASGASPMGTSHAPTSTPSTPNYPSAGTSNSPAQLPANSRGVYGLNDLKLTAAASNANNTTITSSGKNVHLDSGTRLLLVAQTETAAAASTSK